MTEKGLADLHIDSNVNRSIHIGYISCSITGMSSGIKFNAGVTIFGPPLNCTFCGKFMCSTHSRYGSSDELIPALFNTVADTIGFEGMGNDSDCPPVAPECPEPIVNMVGVITILY